MDSKYNKKIFKESQKNLIGTKTDLPHCDLENNKIKHFDGASGEETDKLYPKAKGFTVLAKGLNENGGGAEIVYKSFPSGEKY